MLTSPHPLDHEERALWHLELLGCYVPEDAVAPWVPPVRTDEDAYFDDLQDDGLCWECGQIHDICECRVGDDCGRWRNGRLSSSCSKAGIEECDFECPYRNTLRF